MYIKRSIFSDSFIRLLAVFLGGAIGSLARAAIVIPLAISPLISVFLCNITGSVLYIFAARICGKNLKLVKDFAATGFCGGLTTFSTVCKDGAVSIQDEEFLLSFAIFALNLLFCVASIHIIDSLADKFGKASK